MKKRYGGIRTEKGKFKKKFRRILFTGETACLRIFRKEIEYESKF